MNIDTMQSIALAVAAYRLNGNCYLKDNVWDTEMVNVKAFSNKSILRTNLNVDHYSSDASNQPPMLNLTKTDMEEAVKIRDYTKKNLLKLLALQPGDQPSYEVSLYQKLNQKEIHAGDLGFVASAPMYYYNNKTRDEIEARLAKNESRYVGSLGGRVVLENLEIIRISFSINYQGSSKNLESLKVGDKISIVGKVKDHLLEKDKYPMTKLNYVTIKGMENAPTITP